MGSLVFGNDYRHPFVLAKEAATLDVLSEGRFELSLGAGWMRTDYDEAGTDLRPPAGAGRPLRGGGGRWSRACCAPTARSTSTASTTRSGHTLTPRPVQRPGPPLIIGGGGKRVLSFAARHADIVSINVEPARGDRRRRDGRRRHARADPAARSPG